MAFAEQSINDQWKEVRIKKHNEFVYLKSMERKKLESQERNVPPPVTKERAQPLLPPKAGAKATLDVASGSQGNKRNKRKNQHKRNNATTNVEQGSPNEDTQRLCCLVIHTCEDLKRKNF